MPDAISAVLTVLTVFNAIQYAQQENVDVYINGQQIAQQEQTHEQRRQEILDNAVARRDQILLANQRVISQTHLQ